ncbi:TolC family protein [Formosa algae]|uniref:Outer membrane protein TolC n=1 Tax=Formosa algae TaxID=225843 RepID=A0A9X0YLD7_9FLAO|nr:TolC family protein [Formosa algae]MBP1840700.1 outer membrane protein TolC [Formosa algae]MDQ0335887.1 outer membrane protein TolC [Formosa algae]OEI81212.1 transporter [Formosa algae]
MKYLSCILLVLFTFQIQAQEQISLETCYQLVTQNYPLVKQTELLEAQNKLEAAVISTSKLPKIDLDAYATYQSEVIEFPVAMSGVEPLNKDQYRATVTVNQLIYNGGATTAALDLKSAQLKTKQKQIEVQLYQLKLQINQLYFSILLAQESDALLKAKHTLLEAKLKEIQSGIKNGSVVPSSDNVLEAELLKVDQQSKAVNSNKKTLIETLSTLITFPLDASIVFETPIVVHDIQHQISRPELDVFQLKKDEIENSENLISKQNAPKLLGFATGGYGNPGLNILDNSFQPFYTVGLKLNWNVFDWNANKKQRESLSITKDIIENETEIFKLNTNIELNKQQDEINKIEDFISSDKQIVTLRETVLQTAASQLQNGVITASAYLIELTNLYEDEQTLAAHKIQLELAKANYNIIKGQ